MTKHSDIVDYGYRAVAERRERLLAASSPAVRARILGKPAAWGAGDGAELQGLRGEVRELARKLRSLAAEVEQLRQAPPQAVSQQTPSTQKFDWHSLAAAHGWPGSLGPHAPFTQARPTSQSAFVVQWAVQAPVTHRKGLQGSVLGAVHIPVALQVDGGV